MKLSLLPVAAAALLLAACSSKPTETDTAAAGGSVTTSPVENGAAPGTAADLEQNVGDRVFFGFDSSTLDDTARATLQRQAAWMQQFGTLNFTVEGHTDERGTREYNLALGQRRAAAAQSYLSTLGIPTSRLTTVSYGKERPVDPGLTEEAFAKNRRAVTVINTSY